MLRSKIARNSGFWFSLQHSAAGRSAAQRSGVQPQPRAASLEGQNRTSAAWPRVILTEGTQGMASPGSGNFKPSPTPLTQHYTSVPSLLLLAHTHPPELVPRRRSVRESPYHTTSQPCSMPGGRRED